MGTLSEILSRIDPRAHAEPDLSSLELPDLESSTRVLKLLWRRHEAALQRERTLRLILIGVGVGLVLSVIL